MNNGINVLSCFDGMSAGQIALERAGIKVNKYYASEIDKYAIQITQKNYPDTIQLGSIENWQKWELPEIDLIIGGSPCQGFSYAGKGLNFNDPRSKLFFTFCDILKAYKPKWFMLENVKMKKEWETIISCKVGEAMGQSYGQLDMFGEFIQPMLINSALVSAQNRERLYWFNWDVKQPEDKGILLGDILENGWSGAVGAATRGKYNDNGKTNQKLEIRNDKKSNALTTVEKNSFLIYQKDNPSNPKLSNKKASTFTGGANSGGNHSQMDVIVFNKADISINSSGRIDIHKNKNVRRFSPVECERLQTVPDNYTEYLADNSYILYNKEEINDKGKILCNAKLMDAKEKLKQKNMGTSVFYITKDINGIKVLSCQKNNQKKNVNIVIEKLEKKAVEQEGCVIDITKIGLGTATRSIQTTLENNLALEDTRKELTVKISTEKYMKIILKENYCLPKEYIISILIKLIIELKIYTYVKHKANIQFYIKNLKKLQGNLLRVELSDLKMESIILCSNTQRYKMLGNGWTVDVIAHIFKSIPISKEQ